MHSAIVAALNSGILSALLASLLTNYFLRCLSTIRAKKGSEQGSSVQQSVEEHLPVQYSQYAGPDLISQGSETQDNVVYVEIFELQQNTASGQVQSALAQAQ